MAITAAQVKELRQRTGIGMMECKKALEATNGDIELAIEELRKKGLSKAAKKADRETSEGAIRIDIDGGNAYVLSISCETDFLANSDRFKEFHSKLIEMYKTGSSDEDMETFKQESVLELGENLVIKHKEIIPGEALSAYIHSNGKVAALMIAKSGTDEGKMKQVAMHVTATNPDYLSPDEISEEVIEKEKSIQLEIMKNDPKMGNKTDDVLLKIIGGKMGKFKAEVSLLEQAFVVDPNQKVKDFIGSDSLTAFYRYSI